MLDSNGTRQLAYVARVDEIRPIEGKDRVECAVVNGWATMVRKGVFNVGDSGIYFEVDSKVPAEEPFSFLAEKHYKIKIQKYGKFYSQGLLMSASDFGWKTQIEPLGGVRTEAIIDDDGKAHYPDDESRFLTKKLGVTYSVKEDNKRKSSVDKYKVMAARNSKRFNKKPYKWLMEREWGRKVLFFFFGKKSDNKRGFPKHFPFIKVTDQERAENMVWVLEDKTPYIVTEKCDGSSATYILERTKNPFRKYEYYVCSRNVRQLDENQVTYFKDEENVYWAASHKYKIREFLQDYLEKNPELTYVCVQGELCSPKIQGNPHNLKELHFFAFHMIDSSKGMYDIRDAKKIWVSYGLESVPIVDTSYVLPDDFEEFKLSADGMYSSSVCEGFGDRPREGYVYYKTTDPNFSFKNVSRQYQLKH